MEPTAMSTENYLIVSKLEALSPSQQSSFTRSLVSFYKSKGFLTYKQVTAAKSVLSKLAVSSNTNPPSYPVYPAFPKIYQLIANALPKIQYPKIRLDYFILKYWTKKDAVAITMLPNKDFIGYIQPNGKLAITKQLDNTNLENLLQHLSLLHTSPATYAKVTGQKHGYCCFCNRELTNSVSLEHGYGPICADTYGLPYDTSESNLLQEL